MKFVDFACETNVIFAGFFWINITCNKLLFYGRRHKTIRACWEFYDAFTNQYERLGRTS